MNADILQRVIAEWVRGAGLPDLTPRERPLPDLAAPARPVLAVVGPRRAGITYFLYQLIDDLIRGGKARRDQGGGRQATTPPVLFQYDFLLSLIAMAFGRCVAGTKANATSSFRKGRAPRKLGRYVGRTAALMRSGR